MKRALQSLTVGIVMRVVHAALCELQAVGDRRALHELAHLHEGQAYSITVGQGDYPNLYVQWQGGRLLRLSAPAPKACSLRIKSLPLAFKLFTGQMGLAQAYSWHAFTVQGDLSDVMPLARLVNLVEAYLFPRFITKHLMTDIPTPQVNPLRVYGRIACGLMTCRYGASSPDRPGE